jgi:exosortase
LFCWLFNHEIRGLAGKWSDPSWSHGFLIPLFSLYFINQHRAEILDLKLKPNYLGLFFLICGIIFYPLNLVHFQYGYLNSLDMIATLGAIVLFFGGWFLFRYMWLPVGFLVFAVPLPQRYYVSMTLPMRYLAAKMAAAFLNLVSRMNATANGTIIDVVYKGQRLDPPLDVADACSGMRLLLAFLALGVAMAYLHYRPLWQRVVLLASTIPIAVFCNVVRVTITGFIHILIHPRYAQGVYHDMLGLAMLPLAFGLYYFLAWFMSILFIEETDSQAADVVVRKRGL